jgi:Holliday junction resolvase-like predicted endonuclease
MSRRDKIFGYWGETEAANFLVRQGFKVVEKNYYSTVGEIDIVAKKGDDFYFIEVKTRRAGGLATDLAVTTAKKRKFAKTIKHYCYHRSVAEVGVISASLMVVLDAKNSSLTFRLAVMY